MPTFAPQITEYLERFRQGDVDEAFHGLLEMDDASLTELMAAFQAENDIDMRVFLLRVLWQHRQQSVISLLEESLFDSEPRIWREALDGLVTLASPEAVDALRAAKKRQFSKQFDAEEFRRWLDEAIGQAEIEERKT